MGGIVRRTFVLAALGLLTTAAAGPPPGFYWWHAGELDASHARAAVADMRRLAASAGDALSAWISDDGTAIRITAPAAGASFEFPGPPQTLLHVSHAAGAFGAVAAACMLVMRDRFDEPELIVGARGPIDGRAGAALFQTVLGRAPPVLDTQAFGGEEELDEPPYAPSGPGPGGGWPYPLLALAFLYFMWRGGTGWTSYYAFWLVGPTVIFALAAQPLVLLVIPVALLLRRVLPDPFKLLLHAARIRALGVDVDSNPANAAARRALAMLWLDLRRPRRALPLLEQALERLPDDVELSFLRGQALLGSGRHEEALAAYLAVLAREPRLRYGEAYLRGADALMALGRWDEAEEGLAHFIVVNRSSVEGRVKLARARRARGDTAGAAAALADAKAAYRESPRFHRRSQLGWYVRALLVGLRN